MYITSARNEMDGRRAAELPSVSFHSGDDLIQQFTGLYFH